jgi:predicted Zn-dependent peptidase
MRAIGSSWVYRNTYRSLNEDLAAIQAVTTDQVRAVLDKYPFDPMTVVTLGPQ